MFEGMMRSFRTNSFLRAGSSEPSVLDVLVPPLPSTFLPLLFCVYHECVFVDGIASWGVRRLYRIDGGADSQPIIFSLMVPGGQREQQQNGF